MLPGKSQQQIVQIPFEDSLCCGGAEPLRRIAFTCRKGIPAVLWDSSSWSTRNTTVCRFHRGHADSSRYIRPHNCAHRVCRRAVQAVPAYLPLPCCITSFFRSFVMFNHKLFVLQRSGKHGKTDFDSPAIVHLLHTTLRRTAGYAAAPGSSYLPRQSAGFLSCQHRSQSVRL